jgi:xanthine/uracil permease
MSIFKLGMEKMSRRLFNKFWMAFTVVITIFLVAILFPLLLDKYGLLKAILLACLIPVAMALAYLRGYWIATLFEKKRKVK